MTELKIVPAEEIPKEAIAVPKDDPVAVFKLCKEMEQICRTHNGIGLAAVQVGIPWSLFIVKARKGFRHLADCSYKPMTDEKVSSIEGCLSLPRRNFLVSRWSKVFIEGVELVVKNGRPEFVDFTYETSDVVWQHEADHQLGILISDIGREVHLTPVLNI
jgi:peptide deformylase